MGLPQPLRKGWLTAVFISVLYVTYLWNTQNVLDIYIARHQLHLLRSRFGSRSGGSRDRLRGLSFNVTQGRKFLIFEGLGGQGNGNIVSGLLATHLLGVEFDRIVCIRAEMYPDFLVAFQPIHPDVIKYCLAVLDWAKLAYPLPSQFEAADKDDEELVNPYLIRLVNYELPLDECSLQARLASENVPIWFLQGNTYPHWPVVPDNFFFTYYQAKLELLCRLPYNPENPPITVVHLRQPDSFQDARDGLDDATFTALGALLPSNQSTYLVTNRVEWYDTVAERFHWHHANWNEVVHSAFEESWGKRKTSSDLVPELPLSLLLHEEEDTEAVDEATKQQRRLHLIQTLQMWADWYTILTAKAVYHTHSDFSLSAIHWQNIVPAKTILGYDSNQGRLLLRDEVWRVDGETARLVDRRVGAPGTSELRLCQPDEINNNNSVKL